MQNYEMNHLTQTLSIHCSECHNHTSLIDCITCACSLLQITPIPITYLKLDSESVSQGEIQILYSMISLSKLLSQHINKSCDSCDILKKNMQYNVSQIFGLFNMLKSSRDQPKTERCIYCLVQLKNIIKSSELFSILQNKYATPVISSELILKSLPSFQPRAQMTTPMDSAVVESYDFLSPLYHVNILKQPRDSEILYQVLPSLPSSLEGQIHAISDKLKAQSVGLEQINAPIGKKIAALSSQANELLGNLYNMSDPKLRDNIALLCAVRVLGISKIFPYLIDPQIEEIFQDSIDSNIYINHQKFGRCQTPESLSSHELDILTSILRLESGQRLDQGKTSLMHVIQNEFFFCRFSMDSYPKHYKDISLDIRKMNKKLFTMTDLVQKGMLTAEMAVFLIICLLLKVNITIAGEVNTGKTTLMNALDLFAPKPFRKVYVEESIETINAPKDLGHQLKYVVSPETATHTNQKAEEIYQLLHRSADIVYLGEILSQNETKALFHCLSAGLRGIQTTHAADIRALINRWVIHFAIEKSCLNDLGIVAVLKRVGLKRVVYTLNEVGYDENLRKINTQTHFKYSEGQFISNFQFGNVKAFSIPADVIGFSEEIYKNLSQIFEKLLEKRPSSVYGQLETVAEHISKICPEILQV